MLLKIVLKLLLLIKLLLIAIKLVLIIKIIIITIIIITHLLLISHISHIIILLLVTHVHIGGGLRVVLFLGGEVEHVQLVLSRV